ncbi:penicillin acylase family protein [Roseivirga thermotolerans]|uniref:Beta-lactam antibiotic acylase n=1 Tax=Roseivirga thermotolerans TaxID=1758176 RepID=A0ABQ3I7D3_9BACT|nr:penicillin acylase family protein [Roseivirga thermotolerans]GHE68470.1 beta-lactam antibiotic acylase [Roseivirga thermotolerans]
MKLLKFLLSFLLALSVFLALNTKIDPLPPLGKFLSPNQGIWLNDVSEDNTEELSIKGLSAPVKVHYDKHLIPHVFAQNNLDLYRSQGYITAKHRLWQMEFQTHASAGRLSEIVGSAALDYDRSQRRKGMLFGAEKALENMQKDPEILGYLKAYRDGINSYIESLSPSKYPVEYKLLDYAPEPWTLKKTALLLMYMTDMLAGYETDLEFTNFINNYGRERFDFLFPDFFDANDPVIPAETDWSDWEVTVPDTPEGDFPMDYITDVLHKPNPDNGSNNWAVGPDKSYSGNAILANDPHLQLNLPSIWYVMQLATPEKNTFGATLPGALGIVIGFNNHISWGVTNATRDVRDWYKIKFKDEKREEYWHDNQWKPTTKRVEEIVIRGRETFYDTVVYTHHGPVSYDTSFKGNGQKMGYAMQWTGHLGGNNQRTLIELNGARNYHEYEAALVHFVAPAQNFVFSSRDGDIALWIQGRFPNKWKGQGKFLMDGTNPEHDWQGWIPQAHNAHVKNPERGFVSSANQHPVDKSYPYYVFNDGYEMYRNRVINDFFRSKKKFTIQDFKDLHNNNYNLKAAELLPHMLKVMPTDGLSEEELAYLNDAKAWNFYNNTDSKGASVWEAWWSKLNRMVWDELRADTLAMVPPFTYQTINLLKNFPDDPFMDRVNTPEIETATDLFVASFKEGVKELNTWKERLGNYNWGDVKATYVGHLLQALPAFSRFNLPIGGNSGIVNATSRNHGPSWRMIVEMSDPPKALGVYPGGQSGNPGSKYYDDLVDIWAAGEYLELQFMQSTENPTGVLFTQTLNPKQ